MHADITTAHATTTTTTTTTSIHKNNKNTTTSKRSQKMTKYRDNAIRWGTAYCCCCKHYIRSDRTFSDAEFSGYLSRERIAQLRESNHALPLLAASMCRYQLSKLFHVDATTPPGLAHVYGLRCQECEAYVSALIEQVSGLEKIRSTPLPIAYVTHLRTFLFAYCILLPYIWVSEWSWLTIPLVGFIFFAVRQIQSITITGEQLSQSTLF